MHKFAGNGKQVGGWKQSVVGSLNFRIRLNGLWDFHKVYMQIFILLV